MGLFYIFLLLVAIVGGAVEVSGGTSSFSATNFLYPSPTAVTTPIPPEGKLVAVTVTSGPAQNNLQLNKVIIATVTPTPTPVPPPPLPPAVVCIIGINGSNCGQQDGPPNAYGCAPNVKLYEPGDPGTTNTVPWCDKEPIIYLYPTKDMYVNVSLRVGGLIVKSKPHYPSEGWNNIFAHPDGSFQYQNKTYSELFYESEIAKVQSPETGIIVPIGNVHDTLHEIVMKLGLKTSEANELVQFWIPQLQRLNSQYILIGVLAPEVKDSIDHVNVIPHPDTFIQFNLYFKPVTKVYAVPPLQLPTNPIPRIGFTAVEWGGVVDTP